MLPSAMLTRLECKNFRGFRDLDVEISDITAFLGPNSSGKTTALHAIRLACDALVMALQMETTVRVPRPPRIDVTTSTLVEGSRLLALADWRALFVDQQVGEGVAFEITLHFSSDSVIEQILVRVDCAHNEQLKLSVSVHSPVGVEAIAGLPRKSKFITERLTNFLLQHSPRAIFVPPFYGTTPGEELRAPVVVDRLLGSGDQSRVVRNLVASLDVTDFERMNTFLDKLLGARITYRTSGDSLQTESPLRVRFRDSNGDLELSAAGAGLVNVVALFASLSRWRRDTSDRTVIFLLDEPEAHLHPRLQAEATAALGQLVTRDFGGQLALATHSVDIVNRLALDGHRLVRCDRRSAQSAVSLERHQQLFDDLAEWVDLTPYTAINALASRRLLFVEGKAEMLVLPRLGDLRFRNDPKKQRAFAAWQLTPLDGKGNRQIADFLTKLVSKNLLSSRHAADVKPFEAIVVLDRDYERLDPEQSPQAGVSLETRIWSRHSLESLFLEPNCLATWVTAYLGDKAPKDLRSVFLRLIEDANADTELNIRARLEMTKQRLMAVARGGTSILKNEVWSEVSGGAQSAVSAEPAVWQRGKDRAAWVLRKLREELPPPARAQFPTDIVRIVNEADLDRIADYRDAIPKELLELLDRMVEGAAK